MRRILVAALAGIATLLGCVVWGSAAATAYPVTTCSQVATSTTSPYVGEVFEVSGAGYHANEDVKIYVGGTVTHRSGTTCGLILTGGTFVGTGHTGGSGAFDPPVTMPNLIGKQSLTGIGASGADDDISSIFLTVQAKSGPSQGAGGASVGPSQGAGVAGGHDSGSGGGLPFTGVPLIALIVLALALIGGGTAFTVSARRRGTSSAHA
ncbi:MAG: hypothetical protein ABI232_06895 [Jatrophihabitantaceae bacterium]